jgi:glycerol kinase
MVLPCGKLQVRAQHIVGTDSDGVCHSQRDVVSSLQAHVLVHGFELFVDGDCQVAPAPLQKTCLELGVGAIVLL